ncbi:MAG TPA: signal peptide peptidase SppA [Phycisphaerales bacterium]|nr:signal peptide peptidase SppA [Phycisphaerales bacterium]
MSRALRPAGLSPLLALLAVALGSCAPLSITFRLGPQHAPLRPTEVMRSERGDGPAKVALIDVRGLIADAPRSGFPVGPAGNPVDEFLARLHAAEKDDKVRAVVVRINSPGGTVTASDTLHQELRAFRERAGKPVVASLGDVAASGGYYLALAADEIVAQPTSITGSIGVIIPTVNVAEGLRRIGVVARSVKSGPNKDLGNPLEPMREHQYDVLQALVDEFYARFRDIVRARRGPRGLDPARLDDLTDGRVVTGAEAVRSGLADREGDLREAFELALELAGARGGRLIKYTPRHDPQPRTAYGHSPDGLPAAQLNLVNVELEAGLAGAAGTNAYYLWLP